MNDMNSLVPFTKRQKLDGGNEVEEDSDNDCIIVDVEQKQSIKPNIQPANIKLGDDLDDDIVWVGQTGGQDVSIDLPHIRPDCGANAFSQQFSTANGAFCCQCFCFVCDVRASDCTFWGGTRQRDHCHAHFSIYWNALRKAARRGNTALLQQEHSSSETQLTTHWLDAGKKKGKRSSVQNRPQTLDQFWARAGYTRAPRGSAAAAGAATARRQATDSDVDSDSPVVVLDNAAVAAAGTALQPPAAAAAVAVQEDEPFLPFVRIKREKIQQPGSPPVPKRHQSFGVCAMDLQQEQQKQQQEQQQACALQPSPWQQQQQHVALGDITNTRGATTSAAVATCAATVVTPADAAAAQKAITACLASPVKDAAASKSCSCAHSIAATAALQTALCVPAGTPAVAAAAAAHLMGPQVKAAEAALHAALADTAAGAGAHSVAAAAALQAAADRPVAAAARAKPNSGTHCALAEIALQLCMKSSAQVHPGSAAATTVVSTAVVSAADEAACINAMAATKMATAGAASGCAIVATGTTAAAQIHTPTPPSTVGTDAAFESAAADASMRGAKKMAAARIAEQQAEGGAEDDMAAAGVAAAAPEQQLRVCRTAKGRKQRTTWQCNGFRGRTPKCGSCGNCLNPQRKQACSVNRERIAQGLPPIIKGAAAHS